MQLGSEQSTAEQVPPELELELELVVADELDTAELELTAVALVAMPPVPPVPPPLPVVDDVVLDAVVLDEAPVLDALLLVVDAAAPPVPPVPPVPGRSNT